MDNNFHQGSYFQYSPSSVPGSLQRTSSLSDLDRYLAELLAERQKLAPFMQLLPKCSRLLNHEITRVSSLISNQNLAEREIMERVHSYGSLSRQSSGGIMDMEAWLTMHTDDNGHAQKRSPYQSVSAAWNASPGMTTTPTVKRVVRLDVPVDKFPNYNFVGRLLGPRGNSLKRVEATTECRIYIRGQGSVKDSVKEDKLKDKPGYEHLKEPLHILVEAEFSEDIVDSRMDHAITILENLLKPVDESMDIYKKQQLRELAMINRTLREESPSMSPSMSPGMSPFNSTAMKRAKTGR